MGEEDSTVKVVAVEQSDQSVATASGEEFKTSTRQRSRG